ncbi:FAD-binding oxidoreductase [Litoreibacter arenae]|uniref:FAD binding domain protein n=1 Tax=Litoreibacter arenae DSM 19593 TaxID=1123360 RepID=S9QCU6_9RHOB|nr:FAD-binding oxidoreductase [Litoreibacter arenae]EPX77428.1 FAD binding domain protein [Litoreibacter arenae DSM 19593]
MSNTRRAFLLGTGALAGAYATRLYYTTPDPAGRLLGGLTTDPLILNDASELSPTRVAKHLTLTDRINAAQIDALRAELADAKRAGRPLIASAARHSMGGQSMARAGTTITMDHDWVELDTSALTYRCGAGTRWSTIIARLDAEGFSPAVMQSHNDFGVAASYSVNAHGWPAPYSGMGSTVTSLRMMLADGSHVTCSREENADIFYAAMGGYGLLGVITDMTVKMVANTRLEPTFEKMDAEQFGPRFAQAVKGGSGVQMAYGRLKVSKDRFFDEALMVTYRPTQDQSDLPAAPDTGSMSKTSRALFRAQLGSDSAKHRRWWFEAGLGPWIGSGEITRNTLLNEPAGTLDDRDDTRTDILHEYFIAPDKFAGWLNACRDVIPSSYQELLDITLRYVAQDGESWLSYAPADRIACALLFSQEKSHRAEEDMKRMTQELIDRTLDLGGSYYLPYRPHARRDQMARAYPGLRPFVAKKRAMDPSNLFRHAMWDTYMARA